MTSYMQCKSNQKEFPYPVMVYFRTGLTGTFYDLVGKAMKDVGAHFFGHTVSSFFTNLDWQEKYWNNYWDCDSVHSTSYLIANINRSAVIPWKTINSDNDCMEDRKTMCNMKDGFSFYIQHDNDVLENFSFGWQKYDVNKRSRQNFAKLSHMVREFRLAHFKLNDHFFGTLPILCKDNDKTYQREKAA